MAKKLTTAERIRRYMETHPKAMPKEIAHDLGVSVKYIHVLRSTDKKKKALGLPIRRVKRKYTKSITLVNKSSATDTLNKLPQVGNTIGGSSLMDEMIKEAKNARAEMQITMLEPKADPVNHPAHYKVGGIETIDYIKAKLTPEEFRGYLKGNLLKYSSRIGHKGAAQIDAGKAGWYANALAQEIETQNAANHA